VSDTSATRLAAPYDCNDPTAATNTSAPSESAVTVTDRSAAGIHAELPWGTVSPACVSPVVASTEPLVHSRIRGPVPGISTVSPGPTDVRLRTNSGAGVGYRYVGGLEVQHAQQLRHVDVLGRQPSTQNVVGVGHDLHTGSAQVRMEIARIQVQALARSQGDPIEQ
jgi:hypothetical protein